MERSARPASDPATDAAALLLRLGVVVLTILLPCAAVVSRRPLFVLTPIGLILMILGSRLAPLRRPRTLPKLGRACASPLGVTIILFVVWAGMSLAWTPFPQAAADRFLKTAGTVLLAMAAFGSLPNHVRASNSNLLPIGAAATALALVVIALVAPAIVHADEADTNTVHRATIGLVILVWPALGALAIRERMAAAGIVAVAVAVATVAVWLPSALAALIVSILTFSFAFSKPGRTGWVLGLGAAFLILAGPALPLVATAVVGDRIDPNGPLAFLPAWAAAVKSDGLRLLTGHGFDTAVRAYESGRLGANAPRGLLFALWYELGLPGAAVSAALAYFVFTAAGRASNVIAPFLLAALAAIVALAASGQAISQLWWLTLVCVEAASFSIVIRAQHTVGRVRAKVVGAPSAG